MPRRSSSSGRSRPRRRFARGDRSKGAIRALRPIDSPEEAEPARRRNRSSSCGSMESGESLPLSRLAGQPRLVSAAKAEGHLYTGEELAVIADAEAKAAEVSRFSEAARGRLPLLSARRGRFPIQGEFIAARRAGDRPRSRGSRRASAKLAKLRRELGSLRNRLRRRLVRVRGTHRRGKGVRVRDDPRRAVRRFAPARRGEPSQGNRAPDERERRLALRGAARVRR